MSFKLYILLKLVTINQDLLSILKIYKQYLLCGSTHEAVGIIAARLLNIITSGVV